MSYEVCAADHVARCVGYDAVPGPMRPDCSTKVVTGSSTFSRRTSAASPFTFVYLSRSALLIVPPSVLMSRSSTSVCTCTTCAAAVAALAAADSAGAAAVGDGVTCLLSAVPAAGSALVACGILLLRSPGPPAPCAAPEPCALAVMLAPGRGP